jgi:hypothetical protein
MFEKIAMTFQQAYEQMKTKAPIFNPTSTPTPEKAGILDALQQIKANIFSPEAIQTARNEPKTEQCPTARKLPSSPLSCLDIRNNSEPERKEFSQSSAFNIDETSKEVQQWFQDQPKNNISPML